MNVPPPIKPVEVPVEVMPETAPATLADGPPVHPMSATLLLVVDNLWNLTEWAVLDWFITIPLSFVTVLVPVFWIQKRMRKQSGGRALAYAALLAVLAAIPTSIFGTTGALAALAWTLFGTLWGGANRRTGG